MVDSVLDVFEVLVSDGHSDLTEFLNHPILRVLTSVFKVFVLAIEYFAEVLFSLLLVYLRELLHLHLVLCHQMLLLLG